MPDAPVSSARPVRAAVVGAGVIGGAWAARLRLHGVDVAVHDPAPETERICDEILANARAAWDDLGLHCERLGALHRAGSIAEAVAGVDLVQENVPERLELKLAVLDEIGEAAPGTAVVASSTSGFKPSALQARMAGPERLVVGHPFNPVYLLPLVEVVGGAATSLGALERAMAAYRSIGMHPLHVRAEIDAHLADRLLEAVWREALWLVHDGVATTAEIDDAIRYGFGLRWAQMGVFETYRIAGGEGGMAHFLGQFGECLHWPWTKLTDVPELDEELVATIARQSDAQSGHHTIRELERIRDRNLAGMLLALERNGWGAGETVAAQRALTGSGAAADEGTAQDAEAPGPD